jgi:hypothetical protein
MIPKEIEAIFIFIDFLDNNKEEYINKYIPLCNELRDLDVKRNSLHPNANYKDKQEYDKVQSQIELKFKPVYENVYTPIANKLQELGIWSGDDTYSSIHNNNISAISELQRNFTDEDVEQIMHYKQKYLQFRNDTNSDFLCLSFVFQSLDEILKDFFDFFKDTNENEFKNFEAKTIEVKNINELAENISNKRNENVKYSIPIDTVLGKKQEEIKPKIENIKTEIFMGDKIENVNISENRGQIAIGKKSKNEINNSDKLAEKSFNWTKWGIIVGAAIAIISIIVTIMYS